jgi:hypothetical protein
MGRTDGATDSDVGLCDQDVDRIRCRCDDFDDRRRGRAPRQHEGKPSSEEGNSEDN